MSDNKRKADGGLGGGGKRSKGKYFAKSVNSKQGGIPLGTRGVLVSSLVGGKENIAAQEAIALLTEAYERLCPDKAAAAAAPGPSADAGTDISAVLASEVAELKDTSKRTFFWHSTGVNSMVYVELKDADAPSPTDLVIEVCRAAKASGENKSRFVNRLYPVDVVGFASLEKIEELAAKVVEQHFGERAQPVQFAVQFEHRAAPALDRLKVINLFAEKIKAPHKVNLNNPEKTILVNLLKNACGVAVVEQFRQLSKFNIRVLTSPPEEDDRKKEGKKAAEAPAKEDGGKGNEAEEGTDAAAGAAGKEGAAAPGEGKQQEQEQVQEQQPQKADEQEPEQRT